MSAILKALLDDENVSPALKNALVVVGRPTLAEALAYKREEIEADAWGEDLWLARGGRDE